MKMLKEFLKRSFSGVGFKTAIIISATLAIAQILQTYTKVDLGYQYPTSLFEIWIGGEWASYANSITMLILPILACLPFSTSLLLDKKSGYLAQIYLRKPRAKVLTTYYVTSFLTGAVATSLPFAINLLLNALIYPSLLPQTTTFTFLPSLRGLFIELFYTMPWIFCLLYIFIIAIFGGFIACVGLSLGNFIKNKFVLLATPFIVYFWIYFITMQLGMYRFNPYVFLNPSQAGNAEMPIVLGYYILMAGISFIALFSRGLKDDFI
ncbi:MAG: hypothetical protein RR063_10480 [Anaerovoracaceae bacterium]